MSDIKPQENVIDLRIQNADLERQSLIMLTGGAELLDTNVQTKLAVDFYNHDTWTTDEAIGFNPVYNTLFSFKNVSDDFYIKYLDTEHILVDVYFKPKPITGAISQARPFKLGSARLPLHKLLDKDHSFQAQDIVNEDKEPSIIVGRLFY